MFEFLKLPGEIRNRIYALAVPDNDRPESQGLKGQLSQFQGLAGVCKQIRAEFLPIHYDDIVVRAEELSNLLDNLFPYDGVDTATIEKYSGELGIFYESGLSTLDLKNLIKIWFIAPRFDVYFIDMQAHMSFYKTHHDQWGVSYSFEEILPIDVHSFFKALTRHCRSSEFKGLRHLDQLYIDTTPNHRRIVIHFEPGQLPRGMQPWYDDPSWVPFAEPDGNVACSLTDEFFEECGLDGLRKQGVAIDVCENLW